MLSLTRREIDVFSADALRTGDGSAAFAAAQAALDEHGYALHTCWQCVLENSTSRVIITKFRARRDEICVYAVEGDIANGYYTDEVDVALTQYGHKRFLVGAR